MNVENEQKFFICKHCGNLVGMIQNAGVKIICCGEPMTEMIANTSEGATEKHLPVISKNGSKIEVSIGSMMHPMTPEHYIGWVYLQTENGGQRKSFAQDASPVAAFALTDGEIPVAVYAYCNQHGLWKATF